MMYRKDMVFALLLCTAAACGGGGTPRDGGTGTDANMTQGDGPGGGGDGPTGQGATFQTVQTQVLTHCSGFPICHMRGPFGGNLDLTAANAYKDLVNVPASIAAKKLRVKPGDPDNSFIIQKLTNQLATDGSEGGPMPKGSEGMPYVPLSQDLINDVRSWIAAGAQNN